MTFRRTRQWMLVLLCFLLLNRLHAQFNGPADSAADPVNAPHVITTDPAILYPEHHDILLHAGDLIQVSLFGVTGYDHTGRITEEGLISLPLIAPVPVAGLSVREAQSLVAKKLQEAQMYNDPSVQITVTESTKSMIVMMGEVRGTVPGLSGSRRLFDVLASAGGLPSTASHVLSIDRPGNVESINVDLGTDPEHSKYANIPVFPGDTITTSRIGNVYLLGAWKQQGTFAIQNTAPLTMMQIYAQVQGTYWEAKNNEVQLVRTTGTTRTLTIVRLNDVIKGKSADPVLQADDIIYMPSNKVKAAIRGGGVSTGLGVILTVLTLTRL